jgi:RNA recognition motif-containing protein
MRIACHGVSRKKCPVNIYVGNLAYDVRESDLEEAFRVHGAVRTTRVPSDRETGERRGFGFVEMDDKSEAENAIKALNGTELKGRAMTVNEAKPRADRFAAGRA